MEFSVKSGSPEKQRSACIVVGVFEPRRLSPVAEQLDKISDGYISSLLRRGDLEGKPGQMLLLHQVPVCCLSEYCSSVAVKNANWVNVSTKRSFRKPSIP